jgi:ankyrin repeat protein
MFHLFILIALFSCVQSCDITQKNLNSALIKSVKKGNLETLKNLLDQGADIDCANDLGDRPITLAVENQNLGIIKALLKRGADVNAKDGNSRTPLMLAMECQDLRKKSAKQIFETLLDQCPNLATEDVDGNTALSDAAEANSCYYLQEMLTRFDAQHLAGIKNRNGQNLTDLVLLEHDSRKTKLLCRNRLFKDQVTKILISKIEAIASNDGHLSAEVISTLVHGLKEFPELVDKKKRPRHEFEHNYFI